MTRVEIFSMLENLCESRVKKVKGMEVEETEKRRFLAFEDVPLVLTVNTFL